VALAAAAAVAVAAVVTAWIRVVERAHKLQQRLSQRGDKVASLAADGSWQMTVLVLLGVTVVLAALTVLSDIRSGTTGYFSSGSGQA